VGARRQFHRGLGLAAAEVLVMPSAGIGSLRASPDGMSASISRWWWPVFSCSTPAGATPMSFRPKTTVTGDVTVAPSCGAMK